MIKPRELRLGNIVCDGEYDWVIIAALSPFSTNELTVCVNEVDYGDRKFKDINPVPLTKEWIVERFGYDTTNYGEILLIDSEGYPDIDLTINDELEIWAAGNEYRITKPIKYVHTFQNIMFDLKGEELKIKTK